MGTAIVDGRVGDGCGRTHAGWAYWAIYGTASGRPNRHYGAPDSFGLLTPDWRHVARPLLLQTLRAIQS